MLIHFLLGILACGEGETTEKLQEGEISVDADGDGYNSNDDCNDMNELIFPGVVEICDGLDNDCDGDVDEDVKITFYVDADSDGFGNVSITTEECSLPDGFVSNGEDCDDTREDIYPLSIEICDGLDNDCNGDIDEGLIKIIMLIQTMMVSVEKRSKSQALPMACHNFRRL